jgi:hypothetical protein
VDKFHGPVHPSELGRRKQDWRFEIDSPDQTQMPSANWNVKAKPNVNLSSSREFKDTHRHAFSLTGKKHVSKG